VSLAIVVPVITTSPPAWPRADATDLGTTLVVFEMRPKALTVIAPVGATDVPAVAGLEPVPHLPIRQPDHESGTSARGGLTTP
jgi:hypothetical protein